MVVRIREECDEPDCSSFWKPLECRAGNTIATGMYIEVKRGGDSVNIRRVWWMETRAGGEDNNPALSVTKNF